MKSSAILLILIGALCAPVLAQPTPGSKATYQNPGELARFDFNFPGGTLSQLLDSLRSISGDRMNIVLNDGAGNIREPKLTLLNVNVIEVIAGLEHMSSRDRSLGFWMPINEYNWIVSTKNLDKPGPETHVVYVGLLLKKYKIDDIAAAIAFALNSSGQSDQAPPKMRLHKETSLLIFEAQPEDVHVVLEVLQQLKESL